MRVGIIGGGILGISLGYYLSKAGHHVMIFEASSEIGGLAGTISLDDGTEVDRFYHAILSSDAHLLGLCEELGIDDLLRFKTTKTGFFHNGSMYSMNNILEFLRFPPLGWIDRIRLGVNVLYAQLIRDWHHLENISVKDWLIQWSGKNTYENIWRPLLKAKFDGGFDDTPATYIWSRLVRMKSTRRGAGQEEQSGHLIGGYPTLLRTLISEIESTGSSVHVNQPVQEIMIDNDHAWGLRFKSEVIPFDLIFSTVQLPILHRLIPDADPSFRNSLLRFDYLGIIAVLLVLNRPLSEYWTINLTDDQYPFTGIIETTSYIDPEFVGGNHLVYLPKYVSADSGYLLKSDDEITEEWLASLSSMFPNFDRSWMRQISIHRERFVEPLHGLNQTELIPLVNTPVNNLSIATTAQIYPELTNGESVTRFARDIAETVGVAPIANESLLPNPAGKRGA